MVSARVPSRSKMNARSGFGISADSEKKQPDMSSAGGGCRLVGARAELSNLPDAVFAGDRGLPARWRGAVAVFGNPGGVPAPSRDGLRRAKLACAHAIRSGSGDRERADLA